MQVVVVANHKGGVGKSTLACHLAWDFAERAPGRVAFLDLDPQANSSATLKASDCQVAAARLFDGGEVEVVPAPTLSLFPASRALGEIDRLGDAERVRSFLARLAGLAPQFDYCVVDTRPADGLLVRAALIAADHVLCPIELEQYSIQGLGQMLQTVFGVRGRFNPKLNFLGVLANRFNAHSARQRAALPQLLEAFAAHVLPAKLAARSSVAETNVLGVPVWQLSRSAAREAAAEMRGVLELVRGRMAAPQAAASPSPAGTERVHAA
jgi:chromosome partitioning protein